MPDWIARWLSRVWAEPKDLHRREKEEEGEEKETHGARWQSFTPFVRVPMQIARTQFYKDGQYREVACAFKTSSYCACLFVFCNGFPIVSDVPAGAALALVLDGGHNAHLAPVHVVGEYSLVHKSLRKAWAPTTTHTT